MRSGRLGKSVEAKLEKARARGEKVLRSPREKQAPGPAGRQAGALESELARWRAGGGPSAPSRTAFKQKTSPPRAPRPARPPPAPHTRSAGVPGPADQPSALPGGPATPQLSSAALNPKGQERLLWGLKETWDRPRHEPLAPLVCLFLMCELLSGNRMLSCASKHTECLVGKDLVLKCLFS